MTGARLRVPVVTRCATSHHLYSCSIIQGVFDCLVPGCPANLWSERSMHVCVILNFLLFLCLISVRNVDGNVKKVLRKQ